MLLRISGIFEDLYIYKCRLVRLEMVSYHVPWCLAKPSTLWEVCVVADYTEPWTARLHPFLPNFELQGQRLECRAA